MRSIRKRAYAILLASMYVTGSGYTHGSYKTLHKHAKYLVTGKREHPLETGFGVNNATQGVSYVQQVLARYLAFRLGTSIEVLSQLGAESIRILTVATEDLKRHRLQQKACEEEANR